MDQNEFIRQLEGTLAKVGAPDTALVKEATNSLKSNFYSQKECLPALIHIMQASNSDQLRQLAAVEARKLCSKYWTKIDSNQQERIREALVHSTLAEPNTSTRHAKSRVIADIAKIDLPNGQWRTLPVFLQQSAMSQQVKEREVAVFTIYALCESAEDIFSGRFADLLMLFSQTIKDSGSREVRINTLLAIGRVSEVVEESEKELIRMFRNLLPSMVSVLKETIDSDDESYARQAFEVFNDLLFVEPALVSKSVGDLLHFMLEIAQSKNLDDEYRNMALSFITSAVRFKSKKIQTLKLGTSLAMSLMEIGSEEDLPDPEDDCPSRLALRCIDLLSTSLPPSHVFEPLVNALPGYASSNDAGHRKAALLAVGVAIEGASDFAGTKLPILLPLVVRGLQDHDQVVRRAALMALGQLAEELPDDIAKEHATLLPLVFDLMSSQGVVVGKAACLCIDALLEGLRKEDIVVYLPRLVERLNGLLTAHDAPIDVKTSVAAAIGSAAHAAEEGYVPYFQSTMQALLPYLHIVEDDNQLDLRGVVTDTLGAVAVAVGQQHFNPYMSEVAKLVIQGMNLNHSRLRECSFCFFAVVAKVYNEEFAPFLEFIVPNILTAIDQDELDNLGGNDVVEQVGDGDQDSDPEIDEDNIMNNISVNSAISMEKEIAAEALGELFSHTKDAFGPYVEKSTEALVGLTTHFYGGVRKAAMSSLWRFVATMYNSSNPQHWLPGADITAPLHPQVQTMADEVRKCTMALCEEEDEKGFQELRRNDQTLRPGRNRERYQPIIKFEIFMPDIESLCQLLLKVLQRQHPAQREDFGDADEEDDEDVNDQEEEDSAEEDVMLIDASCDVVISLSFVLGPQFTNSFRIFLPHIIKYYNSKNFSERAMAVAAIGEIAAGMKSGITPFTPQIYQLFYEALVDGEAEVRSNAAYSMGLLCQYTQQDLSGHYMEILQRLQPLFGGDNHRNATDNAVGCVSRMILANCSAMPLDQVLSPLVSKLPLTQDYLENGPTYSMIVELYRQNNAAIMQETERLIPVFTSVLGPPSSQLKDELRAELISLIKALDHQFPQLVPADSPLRQYF